MTMFMCVDLHEYIFVAADRQVSEVNSTNNIKQANKLTKLIQNQNVICTGCGLQSVIEHIANFSKIENFNKPFIDSFRGKYPQEFLDMTKVIIIPKLSQENKRIILIELNVDSDAPVKFVGGIVQGSSSINDEHEHSFMQFSSRFVESRNAGIRLKAFEDFIENVESLFAQVSDMTPEVSSEFDYCFQSYNGERYFNKLPIGVV